MNKVIDDGDDDDGKIHSWQKTFDESWRGMEEDVDGKLKISSLNQQRQSKRRAEMIDKAVHRGVMRFTVLIIDLSASILIPDYKPSRAACIKLYIDEFIKDFFDQNPLSQLGIVTCLDGKAKKVTSLSSNPTKHITDFDTSIKEKYGHGVMSLYNSLKIAREMLKNVPTYGNKEVIVIYNSLSTCDPVNVVGYVKELKEDNVRCSVIGLGAEVYVYKLLAEATGGIFAVPSDPHQLRNLIQSHVTPPTTRDLGVGIRSNFVLMGFPEKNMAYNAICVCHNEWRAVAYICPRCSCASCDIPTSCLTCNLPLITAPHLALTYHHLDPVPNFVECPLPVECTCTGCLTFLPLDVNIMRLTCPSCNNYFCYNCDVFIHSTLFVCPGCSDPTRTEERTGDSKKDVQSVISGKESTAM